MPIIKNVSLSNKELCETRLLKGFKEGCNDMKNIYKASSAKIGFKNLTEFRKKWDKEYSYIPKSWIDNEG